MGRRKRRTKVVIGLLVVIALAAGAAGATVYRRHRDAASAKAPQVKARTQRTVLLEIPSPDGDSIGTALFVTDPATGNASIVLVPSRMLSQVPGFGSALFGEALKLGGGQLSDDTLANQLGVIIDDGWVLSPADLAAFVDGVGGVDVEVDVDLPGGKESSDVVLRPGQQHLGGQAAAAFATYGVAGQPELGRLTRLQLVLAALLDKLPKTATQIAALLPAGGRPVGSTRPESIAESLRLLAQARTAQKLDYKTIPVTDIDDGSDTETTRVDPDQLAALVKSELAASIPANAFRPDNRVIVRNGAGTAGVGQSVTRRLDAAGFTVVQTGNADNFDYKQSQVLIFDSGDRAVGEGEAVAAALGLPADAVEVSTDEQSVADVIVTIGADYTTAPAGSASPSVGP